MTPQVAIEIRQATQEDTALSFAITEDAMRPYVEATWGQWDPVTQRRAHAESFVPATHWIVFAGGEAVGVVAAELEPSHVQLVKLYLRTPARGRGTGALILSSLLKAAAERSQPLRLRVLAVNIRAQAFYIRHGFRESSRTTERVFMEAKPSSYVGRTSSWKLRLRAAAAHVEG
jgi:GNAT superfamily N-acetyltransferase